MTERTAFLANLKDELLHHFVGTTDNSCLTLRTNSVIGWRLIPSVGLSFDVPSLVGGTANNGLAGGYYGSVIGGGGLPPDPNVIAGDLATIGGGFGNRVEFVGCVAGGARNQAGFQAAIAGGTNNDSSGLSSSILGGEGAVPAGAADG